MHPSRSFGVGSDDHAKTDNRDIPREGAACIMHLPSRGVRGLSEGAGGHALMLAIRWADHGSDARMGGVESIRENP
jgi:hypothetical protein